MRIPLLSLSAVVLCASAQAVTRLVNVADSVYQAAGANFPIAWVQYTGDTALTTSAALISDQFLLSAGHCYRSGTHTAKIGGQTYTIVSWTPHPSWSFSSPNALGGLDFSVARLDRRVTDLAPMPIHSSTVAANAAISVISVGGTGLGNGTQFAFPWSPIPASWPIRNMSNRVDLDPTLPNVILTDFDNPTSTSNSLSFLGSIAAPTAREGNLIYGDSGGPATILVGGAEQIVGVCSALGDQSGNGTVGDYGDISVFSKVSTALAWINSTAWQAGRVAGKINLGDFVGAATLRTATIELRAPGSQSVLETFTVPLAIDRGFSFVTPRRGLTDIRISIPGFCSRVLTNVNITNTSPGNLLTLLPNGDPDLSGEVDAADIDLVIANFGATTTLATLGDLDGSGEVDAADIDITVANFGQTGTP